MNEPCVRDLEAEGFDTKIFGESYYINSADNYHLAESIKDINRSLDRLNEVVAHLLKKQAGADEKK